MIIFSLRVRHIGFIFYFLIGEVNLRQLSLSGVKLLPGVGSVPGLGSVWQSVDFTFLQGTLVIIMFQYMLQ